jgi:2-keto-3-deoxy-L-fuconate dehydrogenase
MTDFQGLVAVVTGGASGIGAATARLLHGRRARVAVLDRNTEGAPDGVLALRCDITDNPGRKRDPLSLTCRISASYVLGQV